MTEKVDFWGFFCAQKVYVEELEIYVIIQVSKEINAFINFEIVTKTENLFGLSIENFNGLMYINNENRCSISESVC